MCKVGEALTSDALYYDRIEIDFNIFLLELRGSKGQGEVLRQDPPWFEFLVIFDFFCTMV